MPLTVPVPPLEEQLLRAIVPTAKRASSHRSTLRLDLTLTTTLVSPHRFDR
jgi:hypothetical protein